jgi:hypothetical protein
MISLKLNILNLIVSKMTMEQNKILLLQTSPVIENSAKVDAVKKNKKNKKRIAASS